MNEAGATGGILVLFILYFAILAVVFVGYWKVFQKMGDAGWVGIVPFLNVYRIFQRSRPEQATVLTIATFFCGIPGLVALWDLGKLFGKSDGYCIGLVLLSPIFVLMLGFGKDTYQGPVIQPM
jgi:hypothetical protein